MVVHDLRNPLAGILVGLELLKRIDYPREKQQTQLARLYSFAQAIQVLIDDLLQIPLLESGKNRLNYTEVYLWDIVKSALSNFEAIAAKKNQSLVAQLPEETSRRVSVDATMIHRTLDNLLSKAIKFSPPNSQIIVNVEFLTSGNAKIQVIDSEPGVPDTLQHKRFEKYEIGNQMSDVSQIGLGLAFCKMVVEAHGGEICVRNNQPQGAIFEITLAA